MVKDKYLKTDLYEMWISDGILYAKYFNPTIVNLEVSEQVLKDRNKISDGKAYPILGDGRMVKYWTKEAKKHHASDEYSEFISAVAMVVNSHVTAILLNFYIKFYPERFPFKIFTSESAALKWLQQYKS